MLKRDVPLQFHLVVNVKCGGNVLSLSAIQVSMNLIRDRGSFEGCVSGFTRTQRCEMPPHHNNDSC